MILFFRFLLINFLCLIIVIANKTDESVVINDKNNVIDSSSSIITIIQPINIERNQSEIINVIVDKKNDYINENSSVINASQSSLPTITTTTTTASSLLNESMTLNGTVQNVNLTDRFNDDNLQTPSSIYFESPTQRESQTSIIVSKSVYNLGRDIITILLNDSRTQKSEVISPLSISSALSLIQLGACGMTLQEIDGVMGLNKHFLSSEPEKIHEEFGILLDEVTSDIDFNRSSQKYPEYELNPLHKISVANALFINKGFRIRTEYVNAARNVYQSEINSMDFEHESVKSQRYINNWVEEKTFGKIKNLLPEPVQSDTQLIVVSALYFKALWWEEIGVEIVNKGDFFPNGRHQAPVTVDLMRMNGEYFSIYEAPEYDCRLIGLKYQKQLTSMYIILPNDSNREKVIQLQKILDADKIDEMIKKAVDRKVAVTLPKFHVENEVDLLPIFNQLGLHTLFSQQSSDLSLIAADDNTDDNVQNNLNDNLGNTTKMESLRELERIRKRNDLKNPKLFVSKAIHKIDLTVDERGTEGGAATAFLIDRIFGGQYFNADAPFLFLIRQHYTRLPLFYGAIFEPEFNNL